MNYMNQSKQLSKNLLNNLPGIVNITNHLSEIIFANKLTCDLLGFKNEDDILGTNPYNYRCSVTESASELIAQDKMVIQNGHNLTILDVHEFADKQIRIFLSKKIPYCQNNKIINTLCHCVEVNSTIINDACFSLINSDKKYRSLQSGNERSYILGVIPDKTLSARQSECIFYLLRGMTSKQIGRRLGVSSRTVETYFEQIKVKWKFSKKSEIVEFCLSNGFLNYIPSNIIGYNYSIILHTD